MDEEKGEKGFTVTFPISPHKASVEMAIGRNGLVLERDTRWMTAKHSS